MESLKKNYQILNGFQLKSIGIVLMVLDHIYEMFYKMNPPIWLNCAGRLVAPIFIFLCAEGFYHTRSKKKYMVRLLCGFWFMNIASPVIQTLFPLDDFALINNIFSTLFNCTFYMLIIDKLREYIKGKKYMSFILCIIIMIVPILLSFFIISLAEVNFNLFRIVFTLIPFPLYAEGGLLFIAMGVGIYLFRGKKILQMIPILAIGLISYLGNGGIQWMMIFSVILLLLYNGKQGRKSKYFFYIFYPVHIYILYLISYFLQMKV